MHTKKLFLTVICASLFTFACAQESGAESTAMGVHPFKATPNMVWETTGFSMIFHGGINQFRGDYPAERFNNLGYGGGLNLEYNFTPAWGIGVGYGFDWTQVKTKNDEAGFREDVLGADRKTITTQSLAVNAGTLVHQGMMHKGQVYVTFNLVNAWFPRAVKDIFGFSVFAGLGGSLYHNNISFHDTGELNVMGNISDAGKYVKDCDKAHAHKVVDETGAATDKDAYETVGFIPVGASAEFNIAREVSLGARIQYNMFLNDYVDNRYYSTSNKRNDGSYNIDLMLRVKFAAKKKNHVTNVVSFDVLEDKYYESHPEERPVGAGRVDTVVVMHKDTVVIIRRDTIVMKAAAEVVPVVASAPVVEEKPAEEVREFELEENYEVKAEAVVAYGQSLSQLARKYYNNTFCWAFIWLANRNVAPDPNLILPKDPLVIPVLTEEQKSITKEEAKAIAAKYRNQK